MSNLRLLGTFTLLLFFQPTLIFACGYNFVSSCNTILTLQADGNPTTFYADNCGYLTQLNGHDFGAIGSLELTYGEAVTWESCDNDVLTSRIYYRIYASGDTPGSFQTYELSNLNLISSGVYRTKKHTNSVSLDLGGTLNQGSYILEVYFEADVDVDMDGNDDANFVKDNGGSYYQANFVFTNGGTGDLNINFTNKQNVNCNGGNDGQVTAFSSNGQTPFSYSWSNGASSATANNLSANSYLVVVTDVNGLTGSANVVITEPSELVPNAESTDATSSTSMNGTASANPFGGTPPYTYLWSNNETTKDIFNLNPNTYTVSVTDANGCQEIESVLVSIDSGTPLTYCNASSTSPWVDWISQVQMEEIDNSSGKATYNDFTSEFATAEQGGSYQIDLTADFSWSTYDEYFRVWIDFNKDGNFQEPDEIAFSQMLPAPPTLGSSGSVSGNIIVPNNAELGLTRMRIIMTRDNYASPCGSVPNGEIEDYSINIVEGTGSPICSISATTSVSNCDDAGTNSDPSDDTFTFDLSATAINSGTGWTATINGQNESGNYGSNQTFGPFLIQNGNINFTLQDSSDPTCTENVTIVPPPTCSNVQPCSIDGVISNIICDDSGTDNNSDDDIYTFDLLVSGVSTGSSWSATIDGQLITGNYDVAISVGPFLINNGVQNFTIIDNADSICTSSESVTPPAPCSTPPPPCSLSSTVSNILCDNAGTNSDPSDDTYAFDLLITGTGTRANGWTTSINGTIVNGDYDVTQNLGDYLISNGDLSFTVQDADGNSCATVVSVTAPSTCSNPQPCSISANATIGICDDNGTANDDSDDTYHFDITVTGSNTGSGWTADFGGSIFSGNYDASTIIGDFLISNGGITGFIQDGSDANCTTTVTISAPSTCSNGGGPASYCASSSAFPWHDWISGVLVGDLDKTSGKSPYSDFTGDVANLVIGQTTPVELTAAFSWFTYEEYWKVWIDYNQNGIFEEPSELAFSATQLAPPNGTNNFITSGTITVPMSANLGTTQMRVAMKRDAAPDPCETLDYGEVEDYTVNIASMGSAFIANTNILNLQTMTNMESVEMVWLVEDPEDIHSMTVEKSANGIDFQPITEIGFRTDDNIFNAIDGNPNEGENFYRIKLNYPSGGIRYSNIEQNRFESVLDYEIFPNPASNSTLLKLEKFLDKEVQISIHNHFGQPVFEWNTAKLAQAFLEIDLNNFREGSYFIWVQVAGQKAKMKKLMVMRF